jgi:hypothetical protein
MFHGSLNALRTDEVAAANGPVVRRLLEKLKAPKDWILPGTRPEDLQETEKA